MSWQTQKQYLKDRYFRVKGYELMRDFEYYSPDTGQTINLQTGDFLTQPESNGPHYHISYPGIPLYVARCLLKRARKTVLRANLEHFLHGHESPNN